MHFQIHVSPRNCAGVSARIDPGLAGTRGFSARADSIGSGRSSSGTRPSRGADCPPIPTLQQHRSPTRLAHRPRVSSLRPPARHQSTGRPVPRSSWAIRYRGQDRSGLPKTYALGYVATRPSGTRSFPRRPRTWPPRSRAWRDLTAWRPVTELSNPGSWDESRRVAVTTPHVVALPEGHPAREAEEASREPAGMDL
jgi:hypothetical protein